MSFDPQQDPQAAYYAQQQQYLAQQQHFLAQQQAHFAAKQREHAEGEKLVKTSTKLLGIGALVMLGGCGAGIGTTIAAIAGIGIGLGFTVIIAAAVVGQIGRAKQGRVI